ncbi:permease [Ulvibacter litoralis]|nr:permease [Ulvibacter litoralis]
MKMNRWKNHVYGAEAPYTPLGPFKLRLPFVHYRFELPDYFQGLLMCAVDLAAIPLMVDLLGMPFEAAIAIVMLNGLLYLTHHLLGDPVVPGWITPAIPLLIAYVEIFPMGPDRVHALISFQMTLGLLAVLLGSTRLASKVVQIIPQAIKSGIILGAGIAAIMVVFKEGGRFDMYPLSISIAVGLAFYLIFSKHFAKLTKSSKFWRNLGNLGIFPIVILAVIIAPLLREAPWPTIEWGITNPNFGLMFSDYTIFGVGFPPLEMFLTSIPTAFAAYIVLFGDVLQSKAILEEADEIRADEKIDYNANRAHLIFGGRNMLMSLFGPDITMSGPLWSAMHIVIVERYKQGKKSMDSIFGGSGSFRWGTNTGLLFLPVVSLVKPILGIALALTLLIQGFVSFRIGVMEARSKKDLGIAGVIAGVLVIKGAAWAFVTGILLTFLIYGFKFFKEQEKDF